MTSEPHSSSSTTAIQSSLPPVGLGPRTMPAATPSSESELHACLAAVRDGLEDIKAKDIVELDVRPLTNVADFIVVASGTSTRHVKALADSVVEKSKDAGFRPIGVEGERDAEWILVDLGPVVVHVMLPNARRFYDIESLWKPQEPAATPSR